MRLLHCDSFKWPDITDGESLMMSIHQLCLCLVFKLLEAALHSLQCVRNVGYLGYCPVFTTTVKTFCLHAYPIKSDDAIHEYYQAIHTYNRQREEKNARVQNIVSQHCSVTVPEKKSDVRNGVGKRIENVHQLMEGSFRSLITEGKKVFLSNK